MDNLLHKLCEKSEAELWEMVKVEQWTPEHAEVAFYLTEIMKGVKKIEHLKLVQEAMEKAEEMGEEGMEHMLGKEPQMSHYAYARRGGRRSGRRGSRGRYNYGYDSEEDESYPLEFEYARGGRGGGNRGGGGSNYEQGGSNYAQGGGGGSNYGQGGGGGNYAQGQGGGGNYAQGGGGNYAQGGGGSYGHHPMHYPHPGYMPEMEPGHIPTMYGLMPYVENKINEKVEKAWEKVEKELEKEKEKNKESNGNKMLPPPSMK